MSKKEQIKELRDFIRSHEMRYYVSAISSGIVTIHKAFKVELNNSEHWIYFCYGTNPFLLTLNEVKHFLFKTMDEAKAKATEMRETNNKRKKAAKEEAIAKRKEVTEYLDNISMWDLSSDQEEVRKEWKTFVEAVIKVYRKIPDKVKDDDKTYIGILGRYIQTGAIYTKGLSIRKEHIVSVKYGQDGSVQIELINGTKIIPASRSVTKLIKIIFGERDEWYYKDIHYPARGLYEIIE